MLRIRIRNELRIWLKNRPKHVLMDSQEGLLTAQHLGCRCRQSLEGLSTDWVIAVDRSQWLLTICITLLSISAYPSISCRQHPGLSTSVFCSSLLLLLPSFWVKKPYQLDVYILPTIFHLGGDLSNLSRTQRIIMSTQPGCTNLVAYVPSAQEIKTSVVYPNELHRTQTAGRIWSNFL